ncbi:sugar transporter ERD6-like 9 isoform X4 [Malus sylvestris]|nr:sugar transporter ERD6-like 9 isoform X4 [Malus sylvestris]
MWGNLNQGIQSRHQGTSAAASPSPLGYSVFGSILTIGGVIGELVNTMWLSETFSTAGWLRIAFAKDLDRWKELAPVLVFISML